MQDVMLLLGDVVFSVNTTVYEQITRSATWQWASQQPIGQKPILQYVGAGEHSININGQIYPGEYGSREELAKLEQEAGKGRPLALFSGHGESLGQWCINRFSETGSVLFANGSPKKIEFTVDLTEYSQ